MVYRDYRYLDGMMFEEFIVSGAMKLKENVTKINGLNVFPIPDGDTGDNMFRTINGGVGLLKNIDSNSLDAKCSALAKGMLFNARGNSGVILSQIFAGIASGFKGLDVANIDSIIVAFEEGVKRAYAAVNPPVEGTILTVARESLEETKKEIDNNCTIGELGEKILSNMYKSLENTPSLLAVLKEAGVIDSGGAGLYLIADGVNDAINGHKREEDRDITLQSKEIDYSLFTPDSTLEYGYCTELMLRLMNKKVDINSFDEKIITDYLNTIGDSLVVIKNDSVIKVHVHTMIPSKVLEFCQQFGEFLSVKIENMTLQHNEVISKNKDVVLPDAKRERIKYSSIVVADGSGILDIFKELGVDYIIDGGQGKNPSINDFIEAIDQVNAENVFIFPNNSNIIMAANQAKNEYKKSNVFVVPTKNIGEAYSALSMLDYTIDNPNELFDLFLENKNASKTALICQATRDVTMNGVDVIKGDYIALLDKTIVCANKNIIDTIQSLFDNVNKITIATMFYGANIDENKMHEIMGVIREKNKNIELYEAYGGQSVFDIIVIMEDE